jgi:hypothetical protein
MVVSRVRRTSCDWNDVGVCSVTCGGGLQNQTRSIETPASGGGTECPTDVTRQESCNTQGCPVDCVVSAYQNTTTCSVECGGGTLNQTRVVITPAENGGVACPSDLVQTIACNTQGCAVDCTTSEWDDVGVCSVTCGGGVQNQTRTVTQPAENGGMACPTDLTQTVACNTQVCPPSSSSSTGASSSTAGESSSSSSTAAADSSTVESSSSAGESSSTAAESSSTGVSSSTGESSSSTADESSSSSSTGVSSSTGGEPVVYWEAPPSTNLSAPPTLVTCTAVLAVDISDYSTPEFVFEIALLTRVPRETIAVTSYASGSVVVHFTLTNQTSVDAIGALSVALVHSALLDPRIYPLLSSATSVSIPVVVVVVTPTPHADEDDDIDARTIGILVTGGVIIVALLVALIVVCHRRRQYHRRRRSRDVDMIAGIEMLAPETGAGVVTMNSALAAWSCCHRRPVDTPSRKKKKKAKKELPIALALPPPPPKVGGRMLPATW